MKRTNQDGATVTNTYTVGNPTLGIPATVVGAEEMNNIQEELALFIESQGIVLNGGDLTQLEQALNLFYSAGGSSVANQAIANNTGPADVTGLLYNKASVKSAKIEYHIARTTDSNDVEESGLIRVYHNETADVWNIIKESNFDDSGVTFNITVAGQVQYTSDDLTGASYVGTMRMIDIKKIAQ